MLVFLLALALDTTATPDQAAVAADLRAADADRDGRLSRAEFRVLIDRRAEAGGERAAVIKRAGAYDRAFARLDRDNDGFLSREELTPRG